jgi:hypothetical protein
MLKKAKNKRRVVERSMPTLIAWKIASSETGQCAAAVSGCGFPYLVARR